MSCFTVNTLSTPFDVIVSLPPDSAFLKCSSSRFYWAALTFLELTKLCEPLIIHFARRIIEPRGDRYESIRKCDLDIRRELYQNIVLAGGSTKLPGLPDRMQKEVNAILPSSLRVRWTRILF